MTLRPESTLRLKTYLSRLKTFDSRLPQANNVPAKRFILRTNPNPSTASMNVSEQLLDILRTEGVKHIFGVAGDALNPLVSAMAGQEDIRWIKMKHEGNASFAAFAQAELGEQQLGVCASTVGPGALHLVNGLYNAKKERSPVLAITGQIPVKHIGTAYHQEVDLSKVYDDICGYQGVIRSPEEAPGLILRAIRIALNERCVCRIELPADIAKMPAARKDFVHKVFRSASVLSPDHATLAEAVTAIDGAKKIGILAGAGCREARDEVLALAAKLQAPITHTVRAADIFDHDAPHVTGLTGLIGNPSGYKAVMDADLLLMLGTDFPYTDYLPYSTRTIQVDIRAENIGNRAPVDIGLHGHIKPVVAHLLAHCQPHSDSSRVDALCKEFADWKEKNRKSTDPEKLHMLHPQQVARQLSDIAADDAIFVIDTGTAAIWSTNFMNFSGGRRVIGSFNHGSMAVGIPAAIGAQLQYPEREVWALVGDGAFNMSHQDLSTAAEYGLPIKVIVLNNKELGFVKIEMEEAGLAPNYEALGLDNFDFAAYADLTGAQGRNVFKAEEVLPALEAAKASPRPYVLSAHVTGGALSMPAHITPGMAKNFALSKIKEIISAAQGDQRNWDNIKEEVKAWVDKEL